MCLVLSGNFISLCCYWDVILTRTMFSPRFWDCQVPCPARGVCYPGLPKPGARQRRRAAHPGGVGECLHSAQRELCFQRHEILCASTQTEHCHVRIWGKPNLCYLVPPCSVAGAWLIEVFLSLWACWAARLDVLYPCGLWMVGKRKKKFLGEPVRLGSSKRTSQSPSE